MSLAGKQWMVSLARAVNDTLIPTALSKNGVIIYANAAFLEKFGDLKGQSMEVLVDAENMNFFRWFADSKRTDSDKTLLTVAYGKATGEEVLMQFWPLDKKYSLFSMQDNYSQQRIADVDELTRLPNRRKAILLLDIEKLYSHREAGFCLAFADIDKFKQINDTYGHAVGDDVLRHVADILRNGLRESDWVARWGGEEFLMFVRGDDLVTSLQPITRIHKMLNNTPFAGPPELSVTMSFGVVSSAKGDDIKKMIDNADVLMFDAKNAGRNRIVCENDDEIWFAYSIDDAVAKKRIVPSYTPLTAADGKLVAVKITHGLTDSNEDNVKKMLATANHLRMRLNVDKSLLDKAIEELPKASKAPFFLPVSNELIIQHRALLSVLFKKHDYLYAGLSLQYPVAEENLQILLAEKIPLALLDFTPNNAPLPILAQELMRHVIYLSPGDEAARVLSLIPSSVTCYAHGGEEAQKVNFAGQLNDHSYRHLADIDGMD